MADSSESLLLNRTHYLCRIINKIYDNRCECIEQVDKEYERKYECTCEGDGLHYVTGGEYYIYVDQISVLACRIRGYWHFTSEAYSQWLLVALVSERILALKFPFAIKRWSSLRVSLLVCFAVYLLCVAITIPAILGYGIYQVANSRNGLACFSLSSHPLLSALIAYVGDFGAKVYAVLLMTCLTSLLVAQIRAIFKHRHAFLLPSRPATAASASTAPDGGQEMPLVLTKNELRTTYIVIALAACNCIIYLPYGAAISFFVLSISVPWFTNSQAMLFLAMFNFMTNFTLLLKLYNIYIYFARIPSFRAEIYRIFGCTRLCAQTSSHSKFSLSHTGIIQ